MKQPGRVERNDGGTLLFVLITVVVLSSIAADVCFKAVQRYRYTMQSSSWTEALTVAEGGADSAMAALNSGTWTSWKDASGATPSAAPAASGTNRLSTILSHAFPSEASRDAGVVVTVDAPSHLVDSLGQWYRIRAVGTTGLPRIGSIGQEPTLLDVTGNKVSQIHMLRKFNFLFDQTSGLVSAPQVSRTVEILARPKGLNPFIRLLTLQKSINFTDAEVIDSFDSGDSAKSTNSLYDSVKSQSNANIGTLDGTGSNLKKTVVDGSLAYSGSKPKGVNNVTGGVTNPFTATIAAIADPVWAANSPVSTIAGSMTISAGPQSAPTLIKVNTLNIPAGQTLTIAPQTPGVESYVQIWVTGNFNTTGSGNILQQPNVHVIYYVDGNITYTGSSFVNQTNIAANNLMYGVGTAGTLTVSGAGTFIGAVDAPGYDVTLSGAADFSGAFVARSFLISGGASLHYDEALKNVTGGGVGVGYTVGSWLEVAL